MNFREHIESIGTSSQLVRSVASRWSLETLLAADVSVIRCANSHSIRIRSDQL